MKILKKNQLAILVIALMLVTAGYLNYTATGETAQTTANTVGDKQLAAIGDATLVNSGELLEEKDKQNIIETINKANEEQESEKNKQENNAIQENVVDTDTNTIDEQNTINTTTV
ncbi:MAG: SpoIIIAH-like family protein, partial [Bacilli bacterium]|nr:SpoIIIAH-like family protein [Bacilli bacterium]